MAETDEMLTITGCFTQSALDDFSVPEWARDLIALVEIAQASGAKTWHADLQNGKIKVFTACADNE